MKKILYIVPLLLFCSCSNFLKEYSQDLVVAKTPTDLDEIMLGSGYLQSSKTDYFSLGQCGSFLNLMDDDLNGVIVEYGDKMWSEMRSSIYGYTTWQLEVGQVWDGTNIAADNQTWITTYSKINTANIVLAELDRIGASTSADKIIATRVRGEAHFLRAQLYLFLTNLYGDAYVPSKAASTLGVPLKTSGYVEYDKENKGKYRRENLDKIYSQIVSDLKMSIDCLTESPQLKPLHRASAEAATLLLSRTYLYMQDWENAKVYAKKFYDYQKPLLQLATYTGIFMDKSNPEILFSQGTLNIQNLFRAKGGDCCVSSDLYSLYDKENDSRYLKFFSLDTQSDSLAADVKYKLETAKSHVSDIFTLRTAEGYLNLAEACAMTDDATANRYLNELRQMRIIDYVPTTYSGEELIKQVRDERRKELCFEGHRWFDLRRYAVCAKSPFSKDIVRVFAVYDQENSYIFRFAELYKLPANSLAYTLAIPKSIMEDDAPLMVDNKREMNSYFEVVNVDFTQEPEVEPETK